MVPNFALTIGDATMTDPVFDEQAIFDGALYEPSPERCKAYLIRIAARKLNGAVVCACSIRCAIIEHVIFLG